MKPTAILKEFAAGFALLLIAFLLGIIVYDQLRHVMSDEHAKNQRIRHSFVCYRHSFLPPGDPDKIAQSQFELATLLDVARQEVTPTDTFGKLSQFALCSNFSKIGLGGLELAGRAAETERLRRLKGENVHDMIYSVNFLKDDYDEFPADIHKQMLAVLKPLTAEVESRITPSVEPVVKTPEIGATVPEQWLLVTGGDQSDAAAKDQVDSVQAMIDTEQLGATAQIYLIRSWRRTVVPFASKQQAQAAYDALKGKLKYGGYLRYNYAWCPDLQPETAILGVPTIRCEF